MNFMIYDHIRPCAVVHPNRSPKDDSVYLVSKQEGLDIPDLFGILPPEACFAGEEYLTLGFDWQDFDEHWEYSFLTTNPEALGRVERNPFYQGEAKTRIARFTLSPNNRTCISYDKYRIIVEFSEDLIMLCLRFYEGIEIFEEAESYLKLLGLGLAEIRVAWLCDKPFSNLQPHKVSYSGALCLPSSALL